MEDLNKYMEDVRSLVELKLDDVLPGPRVRPIELHSAMRYSVLGGGKRVRAILCVSACAACGGSADKALSVAAALEILHAYTLVHDDLPAMDDDDVRRGRPSCHKAFGEAEAILAGDALLTLAFELLAGADVPEPHGASRLVLELASAAGSRGVVGGQYEDVKSGDQVDSEEALVYIQSHKTADLIRAACRMGGVVAGASPLELDALDTYGGDIGIAFQIVDDILDETGSEELMGKPIGSDRENGKMTAVTLYGIEGARSRARELIGNARTSLKILSGPIEPLEQIADMIVARDR